MVSSAARSGAPWRLLAPAVCLIALAAHGAFASQGRVVLVLYANSRQLPAIAVGDRAIRSVLEDGSEPKTEVYSEFLDMPRFGGDSFANAFAAYLREKYKSRPPQLVIAGGVQALEFLVRNRAELFPGAPIVHVGLSREQRGAVSPLLADVIGTFADFEAGGTVELALRLHPRARRLVVVTGAEQTPAEAAALRAQLAPFADRVAVEYVEALPTAELEERLRGLGSDAVVFTWGFYRDGANREYTPLESAKMMARASAAPVYAPYATFIGTGVVGGRTPSFEVIARQAAELARQILNGAAPSSLAVADEAPSHVELDWRQARRFGVREADVPPGAVLHFEEPTFWEEYRNVAIAVTAVIALQAALIAALLVERRRGRLTAAALDESEQRMGLAARAAALSTWIWDFGRDEPCGADTPIAADREHVEKAAREAFARDEDLNVEYRVRGAEGAARWLTAYGRADKAGGGRRLLGVSRDVTERKLAELAAEQDRAALRHVTRVSVLGQLSASIAHQLNQPLTAIMSNVEAAQQLLAREELDRAELREICDDILGADQRAAEVIRRLSALFRHGEVQRQPVDLNELARETLELTRAELLSRHISVTTELWQPLPTVEGGRVQLQQVLLNLVMNAADAMEQTTESERRLLVRTDAKDGAVRVAVSDVGTGILARDVQKVFDPFWTTKAGGMGMGLAICRSIVDSHRGTLGASNNSDRGATFIVTLPAAAG